MTKTFSLLQLFSIVDGRLSTKIDDVYEILNHVCDDNLLTHHLPVAMNYIKFKNPKWFNILERDIKEIKHKLRTDNFEKLIDGINSMYNKTYEIPQLKDEFDTSDFGQYMISHSLLHKIGSNL